MTLISPKFLDGGDFNSQKIVNLANGSAATDATAWGQVTATADGLTTVNHAGTGLTFLKGTVTGDVVQWDTTLNGGAGGWKAAAQTGGGITGTGTTGTLTKWTTGGTVIGDSLLSESGSTVTVNGTIDVPTLTNVVSGTGTQTGITLAPSATTSTATTGVVEGILLSPTIATVAAATTLYGIFLDGTANLGTSLATTLLVHTRIDPLATTGTTSATVATAKLLDVASQGALASTTITTLVGIDIGAMTGGATNNYGLRIAAPAGGATINRAIDVAAGAMTVDGSGNITTTATLHVGGAATGTPTLKVGVLSGASVAIAAFDASATTAGQVVTVDSTGHLAISQSAIPTTGTLGTGVTSATIAAGSTDQWGKITFVVTSSQVAAANICTVTFKNAFTVAPTSVVLIPADSATWAKASTAQYTVGTIATTSFIPKSGSTAAVAGTFVYYYHCF